MSIKTTPTQDRILVQMRRWTDDGRRTTRTLHEGYNQYDLRADLKIRSVPVSSLEGLVAKGLIRKPVSWIGRYKLTRAGGLYASILIAERKNDEV